MQLQRNEKKERRDADVCSTIIARARIDIKDAIRLKVEAKGDDYAFSYAVNGGDFVNLGGQVSGDILSTNVAGGFTGTLLGLYATTANDVVPE